MLSLHALTDQRNPPGILTNSVEAPRVSNSRRQGVGPAAALHTAKAGPGKFIAVSHSSVDTTTKPVSVEYTRNCRGPHQEVDALLPVRLAFFLVQ